MGGKGSGGYRRNALPRESNPIVQGNDPLNVDPDQNRRAIAFGRALMGLPDVDLSDAPAVEERFFLYLDMCDRHGVRPLVSGIIMALGLGSKQALRGIATGDPHFAKYRGVTPETVRVIQKIYEFLEIHWEDRFMEDSGNPVKYIFMGKNHFGYKDQAERVVHHVDERKALQTPEEVAEKYRAMAGRPDSEPLEIEPVSVESLPTPADSGE
ncbi:hypothetical protein VJ923_07220 [Adlercreutzia sp. R25]|uniref:hypothetical protein n=1 Tax=Adlercreutzia shanghongiae TaxID=3111773 RepID=UPI002DBA2450|nr:hypothetical protein [Adlercreutzia sp. R25]MEC4272944.1 hypothetical protein [Adlercreutzia sp. R25]